MSKRNEQLLMTAWLLSLIATLGSLYFSEVVGYIPCELCWTQRIFMYPIPIILGVALIRKEISAAFYVLPLSLIGMGFSIYHYLLQKVDALGQTDSCGLVPCAMEYINYAGFITIPFLALTAFLGITICMVMLVKRRGK
ncbi:disulfide oxidoreductase [Alkalihalobacillus oceani]|uniref:disulfide oxidoreductase n=1 Tax=Halalkalibacter oceani TaxID=1653776 RepID=UPI00203C7F9C|nr:disulfide oxidoreductase [Halalkalibacter oceani]MCM3760642.1 disulfide oxidoreductase [Halalkalibacter oceani]